MTVLLELSNTDGSIYVFNYEDVTEIRMLTSHKAEEFDTDYTPIQIFVGEEPFNVIEFLNDHICEGHVDANLIVFKEDLRIVYKIELELDENHKPNYKVRRVAYESIVKNL